MDGRTNAIILFPTGNTIFGVIWSNISKFKTWYLEKFEYAEFNGVVYFFCFWLEIAFLGKIGPKSQECRIQWWYSLFLFPIGFALFGKIWSKKSKLFA